MSLKLIFCAAGNKRFAELAVRYGFTYGAQLPNTVYFDPEFVDQNWKAPNFRRYMEALKRYRPRIATVLDHEDTTSEGGRYVPMGEVLAWADEAARYVKEAVVIIPKVSGKIDQIPRTIRGKEVRLGYSVPTRYGSTTVPVEEFSGWPVHLLGGSPKKQIKLLDTLTVRSADTNYHQKLSVYGLFYDHSGSHHKSRNRWWPKIVDTAIGRVEKDLPYAAFELSLMNMKAAYRGGNVGLRWGVEADIPQIQRIAKQWSAEIGWVRLPSLKEAAMRRDLFVAVDGDAVIGFINGRRRKDGGYTVYEIAVLRERLRTGVGKSMLHAIYGPIRLKCPVDNKANEFYEAQGFKMSHVEKGRKQDLKVWVKA